MTERGILMTPENYGKTEAGTKWMTRRIITPQPYGEPRPLIEWSRGIAAACHDYCPDQTQLIEHAERLRGKIFPFTTKDGGLMSPKCPFGTVGDRLYVKEAVEESFDGAIQYRRDKVLVPMSNWAWKVKVLSGRFMPKGLARLWLEVMEVRVERLQEITNEDAKAEGILNWGEREHYKVARDGFRQLWFSIHGPGSWENNPFVWVITFRKGKP